MRISAKAQFEILSSSVIIGDPMYIFQNGIPEAIEHGKNILLFGEQIESGEYGCYRKNDTLVVDFYPRSFRPKTRMDFDIIGPKIPIKTGSLCIIDAGIVGEIHNEHVRIIEFSPGKYWSWFEECENSIYFHRGILGVGPKVDLILAGASGTDIYDIEMQIAELRSIKGKERGIKMQEIREQIIKLHQDGCKDSRLDTLAAAVRIELPRRKPKRKKK